MAPRAETKPRRPAARGPPSNRRGGGRGEARGAAFFFFFFFFFLAGDGGKLARANPSSGEPGDEFSPHQKSFVTFRVGPHGSLLLRGGSHMWQWDPPVSATAPVASLLLPGNRNRSGFIYIYIGKN